MKSGSIAEFNGKKDSTSAFLSGAMKAFENQVQIMKVLYNDMQTISGEVKDFKQEMKAFKKDFEDNNTLRPSEVSEIHELVRRKSIEMVRALGYDSEEFKKEVGRLRCRIWRKHNKAFKISSYTWLPRKDFETAKALICSYQPEDFYKEYEAEDDRQVKFETL